jgi:fructose-6-phosphate aldolase 1
MELYPVEVAEQLLSTPAVQAAVKKFEQEWQGAFGQAGLAWPEVD